MANLAGVANRVQRADLLGQRYRLVRPVQKQEIDIIGLQFFRLSSTEARKASCL